MPDDRPRVPWQLVVIAGLVAIAAYFPLSGWLIAAVGPWLAGLPVPPP